MAAAAIAASSLSARMSWMSFACPVRDQRLVLDHVVGSRNCESNRFAEATPRLVDAVLEGAAAFAEGEFAPLTESATRSAARWNRRRSDDAARLSRGLRTRSSRAAGWDSRGCRRGGRAGASAQPLGRGDGGSERRQRRLRALPDARARRGRGASKSHGSRRAEARLSAEDRQRRMDRRR